MVGIRKTGYRTVNGSLLLDGVISLCIVCCIGLYGSVWVYTYVQSRNTLRKEEVDFSAQNHIGISCECEGIYDD
ncbi:MAG: hypothetical protein HUJ58_04270 [Erysipelotrichaceae bacterium]|nr:hypothetical protein [Erysipelotrichaceae bacterium]